jgi:hypothetical protein
MAGSKHVALLTSLLSGSRVKGKCLPATRVFFNLFYFSRLRRKVNA